MLNPAGTNVKGSHTGNAVTEWPECPSCGSRHMAPSPCRLTFRERLLSVRVGDSTGHVYDSDALDQMTGGRSAHERMMDATGGIGAGRRSKDGRTYHYDARQKSWEPLSDSQVQRAYLDGPETG